MHRLSDGRGYLTECLPFDVTKTTRALCACENHVGGKKRAAGTKELWRGGKHDGTDRVRSSQSSAMTSGGPQSTVMTLVALTGQLGCSLSVRLCALSFRCIHAQPGLLCLGFFLLLFLSSLSFSVDLSSVVSSGLSVCLPSRSLAFFGVSCCCFIY